MIYFCFVFLKLDRRPHCKGRKAAFCMSLLQSVIVAACTVPAVFNIQEFYIVVTKCISVFCMDRRKYDNYFPKQHWLTKGVFGLGNIRKPSVHVGQWRWYNRTELAGPCSFKQSCIQVFITFIKKLCVFIYSYYQIRITYLLNEIVQWILMSSDYICHVTQCDTAVMANK